MTYIQKIWKTGNAHVITIPEAYILYNNLHIGDLLEIEILNSKKKIKAQNVQEMNQNGSTNKEI